MTTTTIYIERGDEEHEIEVSADVSCCYGEIELDDFKAFDLTGKPFDLTTDEQDAAEQKLIDAAGANAERQFEYRD